MNFSLRIVTYSEDQVQAVRREMAALETNLASILTGKCGLEEARMSIRLAYETLINEIPPSYAELVLQIGASDVEVSLITTLCISLAHCWKTVVGESAVVRVQSVSESRIRVGEELILEESVAGPLVKPQGAGDVTLEIAKMFRPRGSAFPTRYFLRNTTNGLFLGTRYWYREVARYNLDDFPYLSTRGRAAKYAVSLGFKLSPVMVKIDW